MSNIHDNTSTVYTASLQADAGVNVTAAVSGLCDAAHAGLFRVHAVGLHVT